MDSILTKSINSSHPTTSSSAPAQLLKSLDSLFQDITMRISTLIPILAGVASVSSFHVPTNATDGMYSVFTHENGTEVHERIGDLPAASEMENFSLTGSSEVSSRVKRQNTDWTSTACYPQEGTEDLDHPTCDAANAALDAQVWILFLILLLFCLVQVLRLLLQASVVHLIAYISPKNTHKAYTSPPYSSRPSHLQIYTKLTLHSAAAAPSFVPALTTTPSAVASSPTSAISAGVIVRATPRTVNGALHASLRSAAGTSRARSDTIPSHPSSAILMAMSRTALRKDITFVDEVLKDW